MHLGVTSKTRGSSFFPVWVRQRELRQRFPLGHSDVFCKSLYSSFSPCHSWGGGENFRSEHGGVFSLGFSPDGTLLVAGCERNNFLIFDPLCRSLIRTVHSAHENVVTNVKFLDSQNFATGSVDRTVALWDTRNLKSKVRTLRGHSSTIGNIEFSSKNHLLITSGVDGFISTWDINKNVQTKDFCRKIFRSYVLLRLRLNPEESKMIISTARGYLMIVHELDLNKLAEDLDEFELEMFGFAYLHQRTSSSYDWDRFPTQNLRRNRVEIVADFPNADGFNVISALEIHPQGWSAFSRSRSRSSGQEWTCVHDIQEKEPSEDERVSQKGSWDERPPFPQQDDAVGAKRRRIERINEERSRARRDVDGTDGFTSESGIAGFCRSSSTNSCSELLQRTSGETSGIICEWKWLAPEAAPSLKRRSRRRTVSSPADSARARPSPPGPHFVHRGLHEHTIHTTSPTSSQLPTLNSLDSSVPQFDDNVHECFPRLTHYSEEPDASVWYSESISVSADGRLICSPCDMGIRLLSFSPECSEQSVSWCGRKPRRLHELSTHIAHNDSVICTQFSPRHCFLVSGCYGGKLAWYQPVV